MFQEVKLEGLKKTALHNLIFKWILHLQQISILSNNLDVSVEQCFIQILEKNV